MAGPAPFPNQAPMYQLPVSQPMTAGGATGYLKFPDEATARALLADYWTDAA